MINEANKIMGHEDICVSLQVQLLQLGLRPMREFTLGNGKIADILYTSHQGAIHIIEVKSDFRPYYLPLARDKYGAWCHYLWLACPAHEPLLKLATPTGMVWPSGDQAVGLIEIDMEGPRICRRANVMVMPKPRLDATRSAIDRRLAAGELIPGLKLAPAAKAAQKPTEAP